LTGGGGDVTILFRFCCQSLFVFIARKNI
jgi:hypothetical protein